MIQVALQPCTCTGVGRGYSTSAVLVNEEPRVEKAHSNARSNAQVVAQFDVLEMELVVY